MTTTPLVLLLAAGTGRLTLAAELGAVGATGRIVERQLN
jgi:hypothetical protein